MPLATLAGAGAQIILWLLVGYACARPFIHHVGGRRKAGGAGASAVSLPDAIVFAIVGFVGFSCGLMVLHIISGGAVLGTAWPAPLLAVVSGAIWWRSRRRNPVAIASGRSLVPWILVGCLLVAFFVAPVVFGGSGIRTGDPPWHLGWTEQLLAGEPVPVGPAPELGRNAYPWGLHAVLATLVRLTPWTDPLVAYETLHLIVVLGVPMAAAALARRARPDSAPWAAAAAALIGGFGWLSARSPAFATSPSGARYGADMVVASPNSVYELFPPGLPRELGLVVLAAFAVACLAAIKQEQRRAGAVAGVVAGLCGLVSVPLFVSALAWGAALWIISRGARRAAAWALGVGGVVFALWAGPVAALFVRYGGFVDITPRLGKEWPLPVAVASWGLLGPLALAGLFVLIRGTRGDAAGEPRADLDVDRLGARALTALAAACVVLLAVALARGAASWELAGNATLLHQGRVWPPAHLVGAALAGVALASLASSARAQEPRLAAAVLIVLAGMPSLALSAVAFTRILDAGRAGFVYSGFDLRGPSFAVRAAELLGPRDVVDAGRAGDLGFALFQLSGVRLASYDDPRLGGNDLRIRYAELAEEWNRRAAGAGFEATHRVVGASGGPPEDFLVAGLYGGRRWYLVEV